MARIRDYQAGIGAEAGIPTIRARIGDFGTDPGTGAALLKGSLAVEQVVEQQEVSDVQTRLAQARSEWTVALTERASKADLGDPNFASKFNEDFGAYMGKMEGGLYTAAGQRAFKVGAANLSADMVAKAGTFQAQSAGLKARQDFNVSLDADRNTLINDPTQFDSVFRDATERLKNAPVSGQDRQLLAEATQKQLALSAVQGTIDVAPELALKQLEGGRWDKLLDADSSAALRHQAKTAIRAQEIEHERTLREAERQAEKARLATADGFVAKLFGENPSLTTKEVINSNLTPPQKEHYIDLIERRSKADKITTNSQLVIDAWDRIHLPEGDPSKITDETELDAFFGRGMTADNIRMLRAEMQGRRTEEGRLEDDLKKSLIAGARSALTGSNPMLGIRDPKGDEQFQRWLSQALPEYVKQRRAGKTPQELLNPDSKDYIGGTIDDYRRPIDQQMSDMINDRLSGGLPSEAPFGQEDARKGELGVIKNPDGSVSTEMSVTITDESLNGGRPTNIPLLVKGQKDVERLQRHEKPTDEQIGIAVRRAAERVRAGASLPSYNTVEDAERAAKSRTDAEKMIDYKSADDVKADYAAKKITREQALKILRDKGWAK